MCAPIDANREKWEREERLRADAPEKTVTLCSLPKSTLPSAEVLDFLVDHRFSMIFGIPMTPSSKLMGLRMRTQVTRKELEKRYPGRERANG